MMQKGNNFCLENFRLVQAQHDMTAMLQKQERVRKFCFICRFFEIVDLLAKLSLVLQKNELTSISAEATMVLNG